MAGNQSNPNNSEIRVQSLPSLIRHGRWRVEAMRSYSFHTFIFVTKGQGHITIDGTKRGYVAHAAIFIPAQSVYGMHIGHGVMGTVVQVPAQLDIELPDRPFQIKVASIFEQAQLTSYFEHLTREHDRDKTGQAVALESYVNLLAVWFLRNSEVNERGELSRDRAARRLMTKFTRLLEDEFRANRSVNEFAGALSVTPTHLTRVCRQSAGRSAGELLQDRLIIEAKELLQDTDMKVSDVSNHLGFSSAAYFSRLFSSKTGNSPRRFREVVAA